jgi:Na+/H+-dicarboxylate symporter
VSAADGHPRRPLHVRILFGLVAGAVAGVAANRLWGQTAGLDRFLVLVAQPVGQVFLRMLFMIVIPLVFTSLVLGVAGLGDLTNLSFLPSTAAIRLGVPPGLMAAATLPARTSATVSRWPRSVKAA